MTLLTCMEWNIFFFSIALWLLKKVVNPQMFTGYLGSVQYVFLLVRLIFIYIGIKESVFFIVES